MPDFRSSKERLYQSNPLRHQPPYNYVYYDKSEKLETNPRPLSKLVETEKETNNKMQNVNAALDMNRNPIAVEAEIAHATVRNSEFNIIAVMPHPMVMLSQKSEDEFVMKIVGVTSKGLAVTLEVTLTASVALQHGINLSQMAAVYMRKTRG